MLRGSRRIVFEELRKALERGEKPSITDLANLTWYSEITVKLAIQDLVQMGYITAYRAKRGQKYTYQILRDLTSSSTQQVSVEQ